MQVRGVLACLSRRPHEAQRVAARAPVSFREPEGIPRQMTVVVAAAGTRVQLVDAETSAVALEQTMDDAVVRRDDRRSPGRRDVDSAMLTKEVAPIEEAVRQLVLANPPHREQDCTSGVGDIGTKREENESAGVEKEEEPQKERHQALFELHLAGALPHTPPPPEWNVYPSF